MGAVRGSSTGAGRVSASPRVPGSRTRWELRDVHHPAYPLLRVEQVLVCPTGVHVVTAVPDGGAPRPGDTVVGTARDAAHLVASLLPPRYRDRVRPVLRRADEPEREGVVDLVDDVLVASATPLEHILRASAVVLSTSEVDEVAHRLGAVLEAFPVPVADRRRRRGKLTALLAGAGLAAAAWAAETGLAGITPPW